MAWLLNLLPGVINITKHVINSFTEGKLAGYSMREMPLSGTVSEETAITDQSAAGMAGTNIASVVDAFERVDNLRVAILLPPMQNMRVNTFTIGKHYQYTFDPTAAEGSQPEYTFGPKDHAYAHLAPKFMNEFDKKVGVYDFYMVNQINIRCKDISVNSNATTICFIPFTKDTRNIANDSIKSTRNKREVARFATGSYNVSCITPQMTTMVDGKPRSDLRVFPNTPIRVDQMKYYQDKYLEGNSLTYGTVCFIKETRGADVILVDVEIQMECTGFNYQDGEDVFLTEEEESSSEDEPGSGAGMHPSQKAYPIRRGMNNKK